MKEKEQWRQYDAHILQKGSELFYQKTIKIIGDDKISAEIVQWSDVNYELNIQIPDRYSITGTTINIISFHYHELDFNKMEKDAVKLVEALLKPKKNK